MPWKIATRVQQHVAAKLKAISRVINVAERHAAQPPQCGVDTAIAAVKRTIVAHSILGKLCTQECQHLCCCSFLH